MANAPQITRQLQAKWKAAGWTFEIGGEEDGMALFSLLKDGAMRRALIGFYGATADAYVLAVTELHQAGNENTNARAEEPAVNVEEPAPNANSKSGGNLRDLVGKWERKSTVGGEVNRNTGVYLGSSGNLESYTFYADGRIDYTSLISVQQSGCNLSAFSQGKGRATVNGSDLTINLGARMVDRKDTCSPQKDYKRQIEASTTGYSFAIERGESGYTQLVLTEANGNKFYYRKVQ